MIVTENPGECGAERSSAFGRPTEFLHFPARNDSQGASPRYTGGTA